MTWGEYMEKCAGRIAGSDSMVEINHIVREIDQGLARSPYSPGNAKFWEEVKESWSKHPKKLIKEATASASLIALWAAAEAALNQKAGK
jgi:hypothetical protein